jgi:hypothetical protein
MMPFECAASKASVICTPKSLHAKHHGNLHDIHKRLQALEGKGQGQQPAAGPPDSMGMEDYDLG